MGWNKQYAQSIPKEQWVAEHAHHKDEFDLDAEYDKMVPKAKAESKQMPATKKSVKKSNQ